MDELLLSFGGTIKALGDGKVGGYLVRFTGASLLDLEGDYFDAKTDYGIESGDPLPVYYNHGLDATMKRRRIGRATTEIQDAGVWATAQLNMRDDYERAIYSMVEKGKLGWSSGSLPHLVEREEQKNAYYIKSWPLGEASLTPTPAAGPILTSVQPLKSWAEATAHLKALLPETSQDDVTQDATVDDVKAKPINVTHHTHRGNNMADDTKAASSGNEYVDQIKAILQGFKVDFIDPMQTKVDALDTFSGKIDQILTYMQDTPAVRKAGYFTEDGGKKDKKTKSFGDFLLAIRRKDTERLVKVYGSQWESDDEEATKDMVLDAGGSGGYLVPHEYSTDLLQVAEQSSQILSRITTVPISRTSGTWPSLDQYVAPTAGVGDTAFAGGVTAAVTAETGALTETTPGFEDLEWRVNKVGGLTYVSNELLRDSAQSIEALLRSLFTIAISAKKEYFILRGNGVGQPLGILNAACLVNVTPATNSLFSWVDVGAMESKLLNIGMSQPIWIYHPSVWPDIITMEVGTAGGNVWAANMAGGQTNQINGKLLVQSQHLPQANSSGDVLLANLMAYIMWENEGLNIAFSEHYAFNTDKGTWRFTQRIDGKPWLKDGITLADPTGSYEMSAFVNHND